jgi:hypothetical protein
MPTLNVCTLSNIRVASNTHCFVAAKPFRRTVQLSQPPRTALRRSGKQMRSTLRRLPETSGK